MSLWVKGLLAAVIGGAAGGVVNAFAAIGIAPQSFNIRPGVGFHNLVLMVMIGSAFSAILGLAAYLQKSPLP